MRVKLSQYLNPKNWYINKVEGKRSDWRKRMTTASWILAAIGFIFLILSCAVGLFGTWLGGLGFLVVIPAFVGIIIAFALFIFSWLAMKK
jgi:amino acid transporter